MLAAIARRWTPVGLLLLVAWLAYRPGLSGGFLFDDFVNLDALGDWNPLANVDSFLRYLTSGAADPTGRPLSLLSFLLDARTWPADPGPFVRTNVLIHLCNGALLACVLRQLGASIGPDDARNRWSSLLGAAAWTLHPLFVSTTLYIVQREAMLPATFILLALCAFLHGRARLLASQSASGTAWMVTGVVAGTLLGGLSKANGFLLPALMLMLEWVILPVPESEVVKLRLRSFRRWLLWPPTVALLLVLAWYGFGSGDYAGRAFTAGQRLLSEGRALVGYLDLLLVPSASSNGLFNDSFVASRSLLEPATTLPCLLSVALLVALGLALRKRAPDWSAAILFFFVAHSLESSVVPLELFFEHRNYVPALLLFWPLARWIAGLRLPVAGRVAIGLGLVCLLASTTYQRARTWGDPGLLAATWLVSNPDSPRAIAASSILLRQSGQPERAAALLAAAWQRAPNDLQVALNYIETRCETATLQPADMQELSRALAQSRDDPMVAYRWLDDAIGPAPGFSCSLPVTQVAQLVDVAGRNSAFVSNAGVEQNLESLRARLALSAGDEAAALAHFRRSLLADVRPEVAAAQTVLLMTAGYHRSAMEYLDFYESISNRAPRPPLGMRRVHAWLLDRQGYWREVFASLRASAAEGDYR